MKFFNYPCVHQSVLHENDWKFLAKAGWDYDEDNLLNILEDWFDQNQFPIAKTNSIFPKVLFVCCINSRKFIFRLGMSDICVKNVRH